MGTSETQIAQDARGRLIETARAMVLRGDGKFSIASLCQEAGIARAQFRVHFSGKTALMAALMQDQTPAPASQAEPAAQTSSQTPRAEQEPAVPAPDAWLERRLRVFERALSALEARAEASQREQARAIAQLEEKLAALNAAPVERRLAARPVMPEPVEIAAAPAPVEAAPAAGPDAPQEGAEPPQETKPAAEVLAITPPAVSTLSREEMADVLQSARERARAAQAAAEGREKPRENNKRLRWFALGAFSLLVLFLCIGLTLGNTASATQNDRMAEGAGLSHRHAAQGVLAQTIASADFGDAKAEARLALAFLRGQGVARDAGAALRWSQAAAQAGLPVAQYLLGALYAQGEVVKADPHRAFVWFAAAAAKGNLKAMHNLAIAYAEGQGTDRNEAKAVEWFTRAAERGYVDSAFDLAVMYERGAGVAQDPRQALKWYDIAAAAGDDASKMRAQVLRGQMRPEDIKLATDAAQAFAPLPALASANSLY